MGTFLCPQCLIVKDRVPKIGMDCDQNIRRVLRDYANDAAARVELARKITFDSGMSVGGELAILKRGSLIPTRVTRFPPRYLPPFAHAFQNAYYTEIGVNPADIMPPDILHDCNLGFGKGFMAHN